MFREVYVVKSSVEEPGGVLAETLQSLRQRQCVRIPINHAVPGKLDRVLQTEIRMDNVRKVAANLIRRDELAFNTSHKHISTVHHDASFNILTMQPRKHKNECIRG